MGVETAELVGAQNLGTNEVGRCQAAPGVPLSLSRFEGDPATGAFALVDRVDLATAAAGIGLDDLAPTTAQPLGTAALASTTILSSTQLTSNSYDFIGANPQPAYGYKQRPNSLCRA